MYSSNNTHLCYLGYESTHIIYNIFAFTTVFMSMARTRELSKYDKYYQVHINLDLVAIYANGFDVLCN